MLGRLDVLFITLLIVKQLLTNLYVIQLATRRLCLSTPVRALRPPGWLPQWHCGVRVSSNKKLVGFISAIPANIRIYDT